MSVPADGPARLLDRLLAGEATPYAVELGFGPDPRAVIARLRATEPVAALWGQWFGGGAVVLRDSLCWLAFDHAEDAFDHLDRQPELTAAEAGVLGGGWLACLGYAGDTTWLGFFDSLLRWRAEVGWTFEALGLSGREAQLARALTDARSLIDGSGVTRTGFRVGEFDTAPGAHETHLRGVESVLARIERGDFYQVNLCTRLAGSFAGEPAELFAEAAHRLQPRFGALINPGAGRSVISFSPELFLARHGVHVRTSPIKGTSATALDPDGAALAGSRKDVAENIMITDLMRNDLSRVCRPGTVAVERLLELQSHPGVWHLVSTIGGDLRSGISRGDLLRATFPPGSVTGAPKISARAGIAALEPQSRGAYTGALGFCTPTDAEFSVIIRTFEITDNVAELGVGGGITVDSVAVREWQECLHKARPLVQAIGGELAAHLRAPAASVPPELSTGGLIETLLSRDTGRNPVVLRLSAHLARLDRSCRELYGQSIEEDLAPRLQTVAAASGADRTGLRVRVRPADGRLDVVVDVWNAPPPPTRLRLVHGRRPDWSWRHKWADRTALVEAEASVDSPVGEIRVLPYFTTPAGHVAETSRGNLCLLGPDGVWRTPPEDENVLPGITRRELLRTWTELDQPFRIGHLRLGELRAATAILTTSSLSGVVIVNAIDDRLLEVSQDLEDHVAELNRRLGFR